jgi:hypothetical protein
MVNGPTTRPAEPVQITRGFQKEIVGDKDSGELQAPSSQSARGRKHRESTRQLKERYSKLNTAIRKQIWNDNIRHNMQSHQARGVNIQALIININRRSLKSPPAATTQNGILPRSGRPLSRPHTTTKSAPVSKSTTQQSLPETTKP